MKRRAREYQSTHEIAQRLTGGPLESAMAKVLYAFNPDILENLCIVLNNVGRGPDSVQITEHALAQELDLGPKLKGTSPSVDLRRLLPNSIFTGYTL